MDPKELIAKLTGEMDSAATYLETALTKIRAGKASPQMLNGVHVDYYGSPTPIEQIGNITTPDPKQIVIQPWEKPMLKEIEKALLAANLGFTPQNTGDIIRISLPPITEERRKELVKKAKEEAENSKITVRNLRRNAVEDAKKMEKQGSSEDEVKVLEKEIDNLTKKYTDKLDEILVKKEKDIMAI